MSKTVEAEAVTIVLNSLSTIFVTLRAISRFGILKRASTDDYLILIALVLSWSYTGLLCAQGHFGLGRHQNELSDKDVKMMLKLLYPNIPIYNIGLAVTKLSALSQFLRFFIATRARVATWILITIIAMYGIAIPITSLFSCRPISAFWNWDMEGRECIDLMALWYFNASFNIATDMSVVALPMTVLRSLDLPKRQKWAIIGVFAVGGFTCLTSVVRLHTIQALLRSTDISYENANIAMWSGVELNTAIICACMPSLKPICQKLAPGCLATTASSADTDQDSDTRGLSNIKRLDNFGIDTVKGSIVSATTVTL